MNSQKINEQRKLQDKRIIYLALLGLIFSLYGTFFWVPNLLPEGAKEIGTLTVQRGTLKRRHSKTLVWMPARGTQTVYLRDSVYTPTDGSAVVDFGEGLLLELMPRTLVFFDEGMDGLVEITLIGGAARVFSTQKTDQKVRFKESGENKSYTLSALEVGEKGKTIRKEIKTQSAPYLAELEDGGFANGGQIGENVPSGVRRSLAKKFTPEGVPPILSFDRELGQALSLLQETQNVLNSITFKLAPTARNLDFDIETLDSLKFYKLVPASPKNSKKMGMLSHPWVEFNWTPIPVPTKTYQFEISENENFENSLSHQIHQSRVIAQINRTGTYFWRVWVYHGTEAPLVSKVHRFSYEVPTKVPKGLNLKRFTLEIANDSKFEEKLFTIRTRVPYCPIRGLVAKSYYCRVTKTRSGTPIRRYKMSVLPSMSNTSSGDDDDPFKGNRLLESAFE